MNKQAMPAVARNVAANISPEEREARENLAAFYRICHMFGWTELIYNHITARVPGAERHFLINQFGLLYNEITASNLVKIDIDGACRRRQLRPRQRARVHHPLRYPHGAG